MDKGLIIIPIYLIVATSIVILGIAHAPEEVGVAYINGILTASSILFGFWATILGIQLKDDVEGCSWVVLINIIALATSVIVVFFSAIEILSSKYALLAVTMSFLINTVFLGIRLSLNR